MKQKSIQKQRTKNKKKTDLARENSFWSSGTSVHFVFDHVLQFLIEHWSTKHITRQSFASNATRLQKKIKLIQHIFLNIKKDNKKQQIIQAFLCRCTRSRVQSVVGRIQPPINSYCERTSINKTN